MRITMTYDDNGSGVEYAEIIIPVNQYNTELLIAEAVFEAVKSNPNAYDFAQDSDLGSRNLSLISDSGRVINSVLMN